MAPETLQQRLCSAFKSAEPHSASSGGTLTCEEAILLSQDLPMMTQQDVHYWLPQILNNLLLHHVDSRSLEHVQWVFGILDVVPQTDGEWELKTFGHAAAAYSRSSQDSITKERTKQVELFTKEQAQVIYDWLLEAASWPEVQTWAIEIQSALQYWKVRSE